MPEHTRHIAPCVTDRNSPPRMMTIGLPAAVIDWVVDRAKFHNLPNSVFARRLLVAAINDAQLVERVEREIPTNSPKIGRPAR